MVQLLFIGIAVLDYVFHVDEIPTEPVKHRARDLGVVGGGLAANAAVAASRLGGKVFFATRLGDDLTAGEIVSGLEREGVDCRFAMRLPGRRSPVSAVFVDARGERLIMNHSDHDLPASLDRLPAALPPDTAGVLGDTRWPEGARHVFTLARRAGIPAVLDVDRAPRDEDLISHASHVAMSAQAVSEMTGRADPAEGLRELAAGAGNWLAVTDGAAGTWFTQAGAIVHEPAFAVEVVDTLAAGDVWHGALALALAEGMDARHAVRFASAVAALKCSRFGGREGTPTRIEVETFLARRGGG